MQGVVVLDLAVDGSGKVQDVERVSGIPPLDEPSLQAARQWVFEPGAGNAIRASLRFVIDPCARGGRLLFSE